MADAAYFVLLAGLSLLLHTHLCASKEILGLSCNEKSWLVASIGVKEMGRDPISSHKTRYEVIHLKIIILEMLNVLLYYCANRFQWCVGTI